MLAWSISIGRVFGVHIRLHAFFLLLLFLCLTWSSYIEANILRGFALWLLLILAVVLREIARALAAAWFSLDLRGVLLLPTGGILSFAGAGPSPRIQRRMALVGPITNAVAGLLFAAIILTISPHLQLIEPRWVTPQHLLRTLVWLNILLAAVNLLPAWPLDAGRALRTRTPRPESSQNLDPSSPKPQPTRLARIRPSAFLPQNASTRLFASLGSSIAIFLLLMGAFNRNPWLIMAGVAIFIGAQIERQGVLLQTGLDQVLVKDVMLTDFSVLSASATLEDALEHARHSLQDVFPVVRGVTFVGAISRQTILDALDSGPNSYIQGLMSRTFQIAAPTEPLPAAISRISGQNAQLVPILEGDRIVGILTPQNLSRAMSILPRKPLTSARQSES